MELYDLIGENHGIARVDRENHEIGGLNRGKSWTRRIGSEKIVELGIVIGKSHGIGQFNR
jgi:hypothetical protein